MVYEFDENKNLIATYGSGLEFKRITGISNTGVTWSIQTGRPIYGKYYSRSPIFK